MLIALILFNISVVLTLLAGYLFLLFRTQPLDFNAADYFQAEDLPSTGLERYRLLQQDPDGEAFEKIKKAARKSAKREGAGVRESTLRLAGLLTVQDRARFALTGLWVVLGTVVVALIVGMLWGATGSFYLGALAAPVAAALCFSHLHMRAQEMRLVYCCDLVAAFAPIKNALQGATDLNTTLKSVLSACPFEKDQNLVFMAFAAALERSEQGESIVDALQSECGKTGMRHLAHVAGILVLTENKGAGWSRPLEDIRLAVEQELSLDASRWKPFAFLRKESRPRQ